MRSLRALFIAATALALVPLSAADDVTASVTSGSPNPRAGSSLQTDLSWGLDRIDQRDIDLDGRYAMASTGKGVTAYIVDSGIQADTEQVRGRVRPGFSAVDDGDGRTDCNGHGTFVAGNLGGRTVGVAPGVTFVPVRVVGCQGSADEGTDLLAKAISDMVKGLDWIVQHHPEGEPAVVNISLTVGASAPIDAAVQRVIDAGIPVVVAAGNDGIDACTTSPSRVQNAITVNSMGRDGVRMDTGTLVSSFGTCSDIWAPGVDVLGPWPGQKERLMPGSGTSMASPHVAGAVARLLEMDPTLTPAQAWQTLSDLATPGSIVNAQPGDPHRILYLPPTSPPGRVGAPALTATADGVRLTWDPPSSDGGQAITSYVVRHRAVGSAWSPWVATEALRASVPATAAFVQVAARTDLGRGTVATLTRR